MILSAFSSMVEKLYEEVSKSKLNIWLLFHSENCNIWIKVWPVLKKCTKFYFTSRILVERNVQYNADISRFSKNRESVQQNIHMVTYLTIVYYLWLLLVLMFLWNTIEKYTVRAQEFDNTVSLSAYINLYAGC